MRRLLATLLTGTLTAAGLAGCASPDAGADGRTTLKVAYQDTGFPALIEKSGVLKDAPYKVEWALLTGPAANLSALYAGSVDLGHMGDTSLTIEQANAKEEWTEDTIPLRIVAGWRNGFEPEYSPLVTAVRTPAGIDSVKDLKGHTWGYNFGGYNHAQHLVSLVEAGLTEKDIEPVKFADGASSAAAFNAGEVDVYSGGHAPVLESLRSGEAKILLDDRDTGIPALNVWTARSEVLEDPKKDKVLEDFFTRLSGYWKWHDEHPDVVRDILRRELKISGERAAFEYEVRRGGFRAFDHALLEEEQAVARTLFDDGAIGRLPDVTIEYDPRYNKAQKATAPRPGASRGSNQGAKK